MDGDGRHYTKEKKKYTEKEIRHGLTYMWNLKQSNSQKQSPVVVFQGLQGGEVRRYWSKDTKFQSYKMNNFWIYDIQQSDNN